MNRKILILLGIVILVIIIGSIFYIIHNLQKSNGNNNILIEDSYINWAWGFQYSGQVICEDGSIYSFDMSGDYGTKVPEDLKGLNKFILKNAKLENARVSDSDLEKMKEYISTVNGYTRKWYFFWQRYGTTFSKSL